MSNRRIGAIVCFVLAGITLILGISGLSRGPSLTNPNGLGVSYAVRRLMPSVILLIVGLWLFQAKKS